MLLVNLIIRDTKDLHNIKIHIDSTGHFLNVSITHFYQVFQPKDLTNPEAEIISEQQSKHIHFSKKESSEHYNTDPRANYDMAERTFQENRLQKDVEICKNLTDIPIWTELEEVTDDIYPKKQKN